MGRAKVIQNEFFSDYFLSSFNIIFTELFHHLHFIWLHLNKTGLLHHKWVFLIKLIGSTTTLQL